jgi:hypothetical protein
MITAVVFGLALAAVAERTRLTVLEWTLSGA